MIYILIGYLKNKRGIYLYMVNASFYINPLSFDRTGKPVNVYSMAAAILAARACISAGSILM